MKKIIILILSLISLLYIYKINIKEEYTIPKEAIRFRIIANSNTIYDQNIKMQVKNEVQNKLLELLKSSNNIEESRKIIKNNKEDINILVKNTLKRLNYNKKYSIKYGLNYFPNKEFMGKIYKKGQYESLVITIGEGAGNNWWCVLYPQICVNDEEIHKKDDIKYTSFIKEILDKIKTLK